MLAVFLCYAFQTVGLSCIVKTDYCPGLVEVHLSEIEWCLRGDD